MVNSKVMLKFLTASACPAYVVGVLRGETEMAQVAPYETPRLWTRTTALAEELATVGDLGRATVLAEVLTAIAFFLKASGVNPTLNPKLTPQTIPPEITSASSLQA